MSHQYCLSIKEIKERGKGLDAYRIYDIWKNVWCESEWYVSH